MTALDRLHEMSRFATIAPATRIFDEEMNQEFDRIDAGAVAAIELLNLNE
ncbi:hypothetical protein [Streptomyces sp. NPDC054804]